MVPAEMGSMAREDSIRRRPAGFRAATEHIPSCGTRLVNLTNSGTDAMLRFRAMAKMVNLYEAKTHLSVLVDRAADGEEIVIAKAGKPRARLMPISTAQKRRRPGGGKGKVWVADDFDAPLPPDLLAAFTSR